MFEWRVLDQKRKSPSDDRSQRFNEEVVFCVVAMLSDPMRHAASYGNTPCTR